MLGLKEINCCKHNSFDIIKNTLHGKFKSHQCLQPWPSAYSHARPPSPMSPQQVWTYLIASLRGVLLSCWEAVTSYLSPCSVLSSFSGDFLLCEWMLVTGILFLLFLHFS